MSRQLWRTHPTMAWPRGREIRVEDNTVQVRESDGTWSTIPGLTAPPASAEPINPAEQASAELGHHDEPGATANEQT